VVKRIGWMLLWFACSGYSKPGTTLNLEPRRTRRTRRKIRYRSVRGCGRSH